MRLMEHEKEKEENTNPFKESYNINYFNTISSGQ